MRRSSRELPAVLLLLVGATLALTPADLELARRPEPASGDLAPIPHRRSVEGEERPVSAALRWVGPDWVPVASTQAPTRGRPPAVEEPAELVELARRALALLNEARQDAGLAPLDPDPSLELLAWHHSREQAALGRVSHHSYTFGLSSERRLRISFPRLPRLGENVARNRSIERLHAALLASPAHRRNRLDPGFTHVGIGLARRGDHQIYLTEVFAEAAGGRAALGEPVAFYFDAAPDAYEARPDPRVSAEPETFRVGPPGPEDPEHWTDAGIDAFQRGDPEAAEAGFRKALELQPDYGYARYNLARVLNATGRPAEAVALLDELLAADPRDLDARATRGSAALLLADYRAAEADFRMVLLGRRGDAAGWYNLGLALEYQDRPAEAEAAYRQALHIEPALGAAQLGLQRLRRR